MSVAPEKPEPQVITAVISPDTFLGGILRANGVKYYPGPEHGDEWVDVPQALDRLAKRFGFLFENAAASGDRIIVVDKTHRQYRLGNVGELQRVWVHGEIAYILSVPHETFVKAQFNVAFAELP